MFKPLPTLTAAALLTAASSTQALVVDFDDNTLAADTFFNPAAAASFTSQGVNFDHAWNFGCCWGNFTYSNRTDTTTAGFTNDRSAITGDGAGAGQDNYGVSFGGGAYIDFGQSTLVNSAELTNTTYAYLSMLNGDGFAKQFEAGDFFRLTINGLDSGGGIISSVLFSLAEGTDLVDEWTFVDLSALGSVHGLSFDYSSSDVGQFGINTPTYFAIDNIDIQPVPAPGALILFASALAGFAGFRDARKTQRQ